MSRARDEAPSRVIIIEVYGGNDFAVTESAKCIDGLCWDEMLGQIAELTHPRLGVPRYRMMTVDEREAQAANHERIMRLNATTPGWRDKTYPNGARKYSSTGTLLDDDGNRSIFDDVDE